MSNASTPVPTCGLCGAPSVGDTCQQCQKTRLGAFDRALFGVEAEKIEAISNAFDRIFK